MPLESDRIYGLCDTCAQIPLECAAVPTVADVQRYLYDRVKPEYGDPPLPGTRWDRLRLGTLSQVRASAVDCGFCAITCALLDELGQFTYKGRPLCDDEVWVETPWDFGRSSTSHFISNTRNIMGYLSFNQRSLIFRRVVDWIESGRSSDSCTWTNALQYAHIEHEELPLFNLQGRDAQAPCFAGRQIPQILDIRTIKAWLKHCEAFHEDTCGMEVPMRLSEVR